MFRFAEFELDPQRAWLRGPDGGQIRLRPKSFDMLLLFVANPGRLVSKRELIEAIWPDVHVSEDSLFQCIRELRTALGDERRQLIRLVSGRGYVFEADVALVEKEACRSATGDGAESIDAQDVAVAIEVAAGPAAPTSDIKREPAGRQFRPGGRSAAALALAAVIGAVAGLAAAAPFFARDLLSARTPTVLVLPITASDRQSAEIAGNVTMRLTEGLAKIGKLRVLAPQLEANSVPAATQVLSGPATQADFVVGGELQMEGRSWTLNARLSNGATGELRWANSVSVGIDGMDPSVQQSRLTAGIGHPLALRLNAIFNSGTARTTTDGELPPGGAGVVIEQAMASINQTTPERFHAAQAMLEKALAADPDNVDLEAALAAHWLRGVQMSWYNPIDVPEAKRNAQAALDRASKTRPTYIPVLDGYCRFLAATNRFIESLVACGRALSFDPWDGFALYNMGLSQMQLGRLDDALATFRQADQFDTPEVSRWTWLLGAGLACVLMDRNEEAVAYLTRSIAITPGSGRTHAVLAGALQRLGRIDEARAAMAKSIELRPGSNAVNHVLPTENASPVFLAAVQRLLRSEIEAGLPER